MPWPSDYGNDLVAQHSVHHPPFPDLSLTGPVSMHDTAVLVPRILVTPEVEAIEGNRGSIWVAVEVSAELSRPYNGKFNPRVNTMSGGLPISGDDACQVGDRYGRMYDINVQFIPLGNNRILNIVQENKPAPSIISLEVKVLILVHIHFEPQSPAPFPANGHLRQRSDELIDDLENQLGGSIIEYLRIVVTYKHSAFPRYNEPDKVDGVADVGTKLETSAIAVIQQLNHRSPWSPCLTPTRNPLFGIIYQHWPSDPDKCRDAIQQIVRQQSNSRSLAQPTLTPKLSAEDSPMTMRTPPIVPRREASLGKYFTMQESETSRHKCSKFRRNSGVGWRGTDVGQPERVPSSATCPDELAADVSDWRTVGMLRSPRSMGARVLRSLESPVSGASTDVHSVGSSLRRSGQKQPSR
nr:ubiquitin-conjugating enzyme [Colletotrichum truncatum]KAF6799754.1 ubiquitin-conjugating enzyme [Colletotrichum truncatum]